MKKNTTNGIQCKFYADIEYTLNYLFNNTVVVRIQ